MADSGRVGDGGGLRTPKSPNPSLSAILLRSKLFSFELRRDWQSRMVFYGPTKPQSYLQVKAK